jgi:type II secretory pathway component PulM
VSNKKSVGEIFKVFEKYEASSGAKINKQKSEILLIGIGTISVTEKIRYGLTICEKEILLLGVFSLIIVLYFTKWEPLFHIKLTHAVLISRRAQSGIHVTNNVYHILDINRREKVAKIKTLLNMWIQRHLTIQGRVHVVSTLLMSRI